MISHKKRGVKRADHTELSPARDSTRRGSLLEGVCINSPDRICCVFYKLRRLWQSVAKMSMCQTVKMPKNVIYNVMLESGVREDC
jgi:hypothetical protein